MNDKWWWSSSWLNYCRWIRNDCWIESNWLWYIDSGVVNFTMLMVMSSSHLTPLNQQQQQVCSSSSSCRLSLSSFIRNIQHKSRMDAAAPAAATTTRSCTVIFFFVSDCCGFNRNNGWQILTLTTVAATRLFTVVVSVVVVVVVVVFYRFSLCTFVRDDG